MDDLTGEKHGDVSSASVAGGVNLAPLRGRTEDVPRGILLMIVATVLFASASAASKWLVAIYPVGEVLFLRSLSSFLACAVVMLPVTGLSVFVTRRPLDHLVRGLSQSISQAALLLAFSLMPLAGAVAINFSAPLFAALVSIVWLKERAGYVRGTALVVGFLGVLIVTNPGANSLTLGALFALVNAVMYGTVTVAVRGMTRTESANTLVIWQLAVLTFFHSFLLVFGWRWPIGARRRDAVRHRLYQCARAMVLDQGAASGAGGGGDAVLLSDAGLGAGHRLCRLGRGAYGKPARRLVHRGGDRAVPVFARGAAAAAPSLMRSAPATVRHLLTTGGIPL